MRDVGTSFKMFRMMPRTADQPDAKNLPKDVETCHEIIGDLVVQVRHLEHRLQVMLRQRFGPSAERIDASQLRFFAEEVLESGSEETDTEPTQVQGHSRRNGRRKLPADLPRIRVEHDLSEQERCCPGAAKWRPQSGHGRKVARHI